MIDKLRMGGYLAAMRRALGIALVVALSGCGTYGNFVADKNHEPLPKPHHLEVYGGVRNDWEYLRWGWTNSDLVVVAFTSAVTPLCMIDLFASLVADTVTLPITLPATNQRSINDYYFPEKTPPTDE
jgi:uncharacterized protein YceK